MPRPLDEPTLVTLYREVGDELYAFVSRRCDGDRALAEDVVQETWLRAVREWRRIGVPDVPMAWLRVVARNLLLNQLRRAPGVALELVREDALAALDQEEQVDRAERDALLAAALARLPRHEEQLLRAFHLEQHRVADLATRMGISERAVEGRLRRARERLREELGPSFPYIVGGLS